MLLSFKKHVETKKPILFTSLMFTKNLKLLLFHTFRLLSSSDNDINRSILFSLSKYCLKFVI